MPYSLLFRRKSKEYHYDLTNNDILNLLRAAYKEGNQKEAVTYTLLTRFAWLYPEGIYKDLSSFISAYAQPLNPKWFPTGSAHLATIKSLKSKYSGAELQVKIDRANKLANQRVLNTTLDESNIPEKTKNVVYGILKGEIVNPVKGSVHFVSSMAKASDNKNVAYQKQVNFASSRSDLDKAIDYGGSVQGNNWFFTTPGSGSFLVQIERNKAIEAGMGFPGYFIIAGLGMYLLMKFTRKYGN